MCLDTVDEDIKKTKGYGWKWFAEYSGEGSLHGPCNPCPPVDSFKPNVWITDKKQGRVDGGGYETGFHVFRTKEGARKWFLRGSWCHLRKVQYDDVVATGEQCSNRVIVARKMKILK